MLPCLVFNICDGCFFGPRSAIGVSRLLVRQKHRLQQGRAPLAATQTQSEGLIHHANDSMGNNILLVLIFTCFANIYNRTIAPTYDWQRLGLIRWL